jgi:phage tail-like protein
MNRSSFARVGGGLALGALFAGCPTEKAAPDAGVATPATCAAADAGTPDAGTSDAGTSEAKHVPVTFEAKIFALGDTNVQATIEAGSLLGAQLSRDGDATGTLTATYSLNVSPLTLIDAQTSDGALLLKWREAMAAYLKQCPASPKPDPACASGDVWKKNVDAHRDVTLSARTADGTVLATWRFPDVFPTALVMSGTDGSIAIPRMQIAPSEAVLEVADSTALPGGLSPSEARLALAAAGPEDDATLQFQTAYVAPLDLLALMNRGAGPGTLYVEASTQRCAGANASPLCLPATQDPSAGKHLGDYLPAHNFKVEIDGVITGGFKDVGGLEAEVEVVEYKDGDGMVTRKRPGRTKFSNIILRVGNADQAGLFTWRKAVIDGRTDRKSGSIIVLDRGGKESLRFNFFEAWPCRWKAPALNSPGDAFLVEEIVLASTKIQRQ